MAEALVAGAGLGAGFTVLYDVINKGMVGKFIQFKPLLAALRSTLDSIQPLIIRQIGEHNLKLDLPNEEIRELEKQMKEGEELICKLSKLRWWNRIKSRYTSQLVELDRSLKGLLKQVLMQQARDIKENLLVAKQTARQLVEFQEFNERLLRERTLLQEDARESQEKFLLALQNNGKKLVELQAVIEEMMKQQEARDVTNAVAAAEGNQLEEPNLMSIFKDLYEALQQLFNENNTYKPVLISIKSTLDSLPPLIEVTENTIYLRVHESLKEILLEQDREQYQELKEKLKNVRMQMLEGVELFRNFSKHHPWNFCKKSHNAYKLIQWDESLQRHVKKLMEKKRSIKSNYF
ncbi:hypothetical protein ABKV19_012396 [Rosa sericea]